jgi:hypothetical protein
VPIFRALPRCNRLSSAFGRYRQGLAQQRISAVARMRRKLGPRFCLGIGGPRRARQLGSAPMRSQRHRLCYWFAPSPADFLAWHRCAQQVAAAAGPLLVFAASPPRAQEALVIGWRWLACTGRRRRGPQPLLRRRPRGGLALARRRRRALAGRAGHGQACPSSDQHPEHRARSPPNQGDDKLACARPMPRHGLWLLAVMVTGMGVGNAFEIGLLARPTAMK